MSNLSRAGQTIRYSSPGRRPSATNMKRQQAEKIKPAADTPGVINGIQAGSSYEWNVAKALWTTGWQFDYQVPILGGRSRRGGQVVDFIIHTVPLFTPLAVNGGHWHQNSALEELKATDVQKSLGYPVNAVLTAWDPDCNTYDAAYRFIFQHFGRA